MRCSAANHEAPIEVRKGQFLDDVVKESEFPDDVRNADDADLPETYSDDGDAEGLPPTQCNLILVSGCVKISSSMPLCTSPSAHEMSGQVDQSAREMGRSPMMAERFQTCSLFRLCMSAAAELEAFYTILTESFEDVDVENVGLISVEVSPAPFFLFSARFASHLPFASAPLTPYARIRTFRIARWSHAAIRDYSGPAYGGGRLDSIRARRS
jgi:hypothetical protein